VPIKLEEEFEEEGNGALTNFYGALNMCLNSKKSSDHFKQKK